MPGDQIYLQGLLSSNPEEVNKAVMLLYQKYYPGVSSYFLKRGLGTMDIEDIFQDGIMSFLNALKAGKIKESANAGGYFFTICKHIGIKKGTKAARIPLVDIDYQQIEEIPAEGNNTAEEDERNQLRMSSWKLMESLGKSCEDLLKKSYVENKKIIAFYAELGYKNAQVARTAKYKCLKRLKEKLAKDPIAQHLLKTLFS